MHGKGVYTQIIEGKEKIYDGDFVNGKKEGEGTLLMTDGRKYKGKWLNGKQHGLGEIVLQNGDIKKGEWYQGERIKWIKTTT
jgi:hypothetical protein